MAKLRQNMCFILLLIILISDFAKSQNNVCSTYRGYLMPQRSKNCYHSPDLFDTVPHITQRYTGVSETHYVLTDDKYNLTIYRIPNSNPRGVIVMKHASLLCDSSLWVNQENSSLAFALWRKGYDIWLTNERGTKYSLGHESLKPKDAKFWNFTIHEIGIYDIKANLDYIKKNTGGKKLIILDHSTGFSSSLIYASERPQEAIDNIKIIIAMAPVAFLEKMRPFINLVANSQPIFKLYKQIMRRESVLRFNKMWADAIIGFRLKLPIVLFKAATLGWTPNELDLRYLNLMESEMPSGTSWKNGFHFCQIVKSGGKFQKYDYGRQKNLQIYGSSQPPLYPVEKVQVPMFMIYSKDDYISTERNINTLRERLPNEAKVFGVVKVDGMNHLDFSYGKHRYERVYRHVFDVLEKL